MKDDVWIYCCGNADWKTDTSVKSHELSSFYDKQTEMKTRRTSGGSSGGRLWEEQVEVLT